MKYVMPGAFLSGAGLLSNLYSTSTQRRLDAGCLSYRAVIRHILIMASHCTGSNKKKHSTNSKDVSFLQKVTYVGHVTLKGQFYPGNFSGGRGRKGGRGHRDKRTANSNYSKIMTKGPLSATQPIRVTFRCNQSQLKAAY